MLEYAKVLKSIGADVKFVDADVSYVRQADGTYKMTFKADRDPRMAGELVQMTHEPNRTVFYAAGLFHTREETHDDMPDFPENGTKGQVSALAEAAKSLGRDNIFSIAFPLC